MPLDRRRWLAIAVVAGAVLIAHRPGTHATAWHFFDDAAQALVGRSGEGDAHGLRLYGDHPEWQFGPVSILAALPFSLLGRTVGPYAVMVATTAAGLVVVALVLATVERLVASEAVPARPRPAVPAGPATVAAVVLVITWGDVAVRTAHLDDALALLALAAALHAVAGGRRNSPVVWLALAAAAKPWAIVAAPLAFVAPGAVTARVARVATVGAAAAATWAPFVLAEPSTLEVRGFGIENDATSVLRALGVDAAVTPSWVRPVQLLGGMTLAALLVLARRWPAVVLAGLAWRLLLDPGAHRYYTVGFVIGAAIVELTRRPSSRPWGTVVAAALLELTALPDAPGSLRYVRLVVVVAALVVAWRCRPTTTAATLSAPPTAAGASSR